MISNRILTLFVALTLLSATTSFSQSNKPATRTEPPSPFLVQSIPEHCRGKRLEKDYYYIESSKMLPKGPWCVALLMHAFVPPGKPYFSWRDFEMKIVGVVAINIQTRKVLFLRSQLAGAGDGKACEITNVRNLSSNSCAIEVAESSWIDEGERKNFYEETTTWKWTLPTGKFTRLGANMHVLDLAVALDRTPYSVNWPETFRRDWNGKVNIVGAGGKPKFSLQTVDTSVQNKIKNYNKIGVLIGRFPGDLDLLWSDDRDFAPASNPHSLVVLHDRPYGDTTNKILLEGIRLSAKPTVKWSQRVKSIGSVVKGRVRQVRLISGVARPCLELPILVLSPGGTDWLCSLNTETGRIRKVHKFGEDSLFPIASPSGKTVANYNGETSDKDNKILIIDTKTGKTRERVLTLHDLGIDEPLSDDENFTYPLVTPLGFGRDETILLKDINKIWALPPPYTGRPQLVFSLPRHSKTPQKSKTTRQKIR